jgi:Trk-type K+ transport system membrane component
MNVTALEWIAITLTLAGVINFILLIYVAHRKLDQIEPYFKKSKLVNDTAVTWRTRELLVVFTAAASFLYH